MRLLARIMSAIGRALRTSFRRLANGTLVPVFAWTTSFVDGVFHRGAIETKEVIEDIAGEIEIAQEARSAIEKNVVLPKPTLAEIVKQACACRDEGTSFLALLDGNNPAHSKAAAWVASLDETGLRTVRHMPVPTLSKHLDPRDSYRAHGGLPAFGAGLVTPGRQAFDVRRRERRDASGTAREILQRALAEGRKPSLNDLVDVETAYRRSASC